MNKFIKGSILAVIGLFLLLLLVTGGNILFFWSAFNWIQGGIHAVTGFDTLLDKTLAALLLAVLVMLPFGRILLSFTLIPIKKKGIYRSILFGGIAVFFLLTFFASRNTFFDQKTGKPVKYYSLRPNGDYIYYTGPGFDPITGDSLREVTPEVSAKSNGLESKNNNPFDPKTGQPLEYYVLRPNGEYKLFPAPGFDPITGDSLKRVTREISLKGQGLLPTADNDFDPKTGEALKYYSQRPNGEYKIFSEPGYDPVTGDRLKKVTREISLKNRGLWPTDIPATEPPKAQLNHKTHDYSNYNQTPATEENQLSPSPPPESAPIVSSKEHPVNSWNNVRPAESYVTFHNETRLAFKVYDAYGKFFKVIYPRQTTREKMSPGRYIHSGGGITKNFTVTEGKNLSVNFYSKYWLNRSFNRSYPPVRLNNRRFY